MKAIKAEDVAQSVQPSELDTLLEAHSQARAEAREAIYKVRSLEESLEVAIGLPPLLRHGIVRVNWFKLRDRIGGKGY